MNIGDRLKKLRIERDMTLEEVGAYIGASKQTLHKYENGLVTNIPSDKIELLAKLFRVSPAYIMGWLGTIYTENDVSELNTTLNPYGVNVELINEDDPDWAIMYNGKYYGSDIDGLIDLYEENKCENSNILAETIASYFAHQEERTFRDKKVITINNSKAVPLVGQIAAGVPILAEENIESYFAIDASIKADFCLRVKGDSMIDEDILPGDIVFIRMQPTLENGEIGAIILGEEATLKTFYRNNGQIILQPANKNYTPMVIENQEVRVAGKLVAVLNIRD